MLLTPNQLRAARMLLGMTQADLAKAAKVGIATVKRFELGQEIGELYLDAICRAVEGAGATLIAPGTSIEDRIVGPGVALVGKALGKKPIR